MEQAKCPGIYHRESMRPAPFRHCQECGELVNGKIPLKDDCIKDHTLRKTKGYYFCPDCGERLKKQ